MVSVLQGATIDATNPQLFFISQLEGRLVDLFSLTWEVFEKTSNEKILCPVSLASGTVDLVADRISIGYYFAAQSFAADQKSGLYDIRWAWQFTDGGETFNGRYEFEILVGIAVLSMGPNYALVDDLRAEGVETTTSDGRIQMAIVLASSFIERFTGRYFEPRKVTQQLDGKGTHLQLFTDPVIALSSVIIDTSSTTLPSLIAELNNLRIYNRHLRGMMQPDDRNSPKVAFDSRLRNDRQLHFDSGLFSRGTLNIELAGFFGYTEADGTPFGKTPALIRHVAKLLVLREIPVLSDASCREQLNQKWKIAEERVRDQSIRYNTERKMGSFTGDSEIDTILLMHMRPPELGAI